ncbi:hypothetical protein [Candidatus Enterococcus murrayae]|uniref:Uncharacterized protein n=1 Tax=Candidatus Enterococcus murrayae TaxID=2815321 RepID=A0ABS3HCL8_9ENTE|nr:hypothetical protein [Enterococcus sp. MJM16]MBO0450782.1 hypothetical protein [Enterococcus sp. MJM16]
MKTLKASVRFINDLERQRRTEKVYHYLTMIPDLNEGDLVVVETQYGYAVAEFIAYKDVIRKAAKSFIIQKVDTSHIDNQKEQQRKIESLKAKIDEKAKEALQRKKLNELAQDDIELKMLLDTLDSLEGNV